MLCFICLKNTSTLPDANHLVEEHGWPSFDSAPLKLQIGAYFWQHNFVVQSLAILLSTSSRVEYLSLVSKLAPFKKARFLLPPNYTENSRCAMLWKWEYERFSKRLITALQGNPFHGSL
jgi:hypothetical protein